MDAHPLERLVESQRIFWLIAGFTVVLFLVTNLPWQLDDHDQAKQAFTSFEMVKDGRWLYQHTPHQHVATKPPLVGWISAGLFAVTRSWDAAWRLPSFVAAIAIFLLLWRAATSAYGAIAGLIASAAFAFNLLSPRLATLVRTDMPLALVIFLLGLLTWRKIGEGKPWSARDRLSMFALLTVAMLTKGPIIYAFLLPGLALFQWRYRRARPPGALQQNVASAWPGWWPWFASLGIFLAWVVGGIFFEKDFFDEVVMREFLARFGESVHRPQPLLFYVPHLLHKFFPWSFLMIAIAAADVLWYRRRNKGADFQSSSQQPNADTAGTIWLLCWIFGGLIVMSLVPSKRVDRIFPIIPPLCLLLAAQVWRVDRAFACSMLDTRRQSRDYLGSAAEQSIHLEHQSGEVLLQNKSAHGAIYKWTAATLALAFIFTSGYTLRKVLYGYHHHSDALAAFGRDVRAEAATHRWRYAVVRSHDEGMLLYLEKTHFVEPEDAVEEWNRGNLDALVISTGKAPALMEELRGAKISQLKSESKKTEQKANYVLITH